MKPSTSTENVHKRRTFCNQWLDICFKFQLSFPTLKINKPTFKCNLLSPSNATAYKDKHTTIFYSLRLVLLGPLRLARTPFHTSIYGPLSARYPKIVAPILVSKIPRQEVKLHICFNCQGKTLTQLSRLQFYKMKLTMKGNSPTLAARPLTISGSSSCPLLCFGFPECKIPYFKINILPYFNIAVTILQTHTSEVLMSLLCQVSGLMRV